MTFFQIDRCCPNKHNCDQRSQDELAIPQQCLFSILRSRSNELSGERRLSMNETGMTSVALDIIDSRLIAELQKDNRVGVAELCDRIGLTPATCHRRLKRLRESGIILKEAALVDPRLSARPLTVIIEITLSQNRIAFEKKLRRLPEISMCWAVSGPVDFFVVSHFRDIEHYRDFMVAEFIDDENVKRQTSAIVVDRLRFNLEMDFVVET